MEPWKWFSQHLNKASSCLCMSEVAGILSSSLGCRWHCGYFCLAHGSGWQLKVMRRVTVCVSLVYFYDNEAKINPLHTVREEPIWWRDFSKVPKMLFKCWMMDWKRKRYNNGFHLSHGHEVLWLGIKYEMVLGLVLPDNPTELPSCFHFFIQSNVVFMIACLQWLAFPPVSFKEICQHIAASVSSTLLAIYVWNWFGLWYKTSSFLILPSKFWLAQLFLQRRMHQTSAFSVSWGTRVFTHVMLKMTMKEKCLN